LQELELDFEEVAFAHVSGFVAGFADVDGLLEAVEVLLGKIDGGLGEDDADELLGDAKDDQALVIGNLRACDGGLILGRLEAVLALPAALEEIADAQIELGLVVDVIGSELARLEDRQELGVPGKHRIGTEIGGDFLRLVFQDGGASGQEGVIVLKGEADGLFERDTRGGRLRGCWCR
jgi:hypothetical protein